MLSHNRKILHKIKQTETESHSVDQSEFFLDTINLPRNPENLVSISQIKNELSDWNITLLSNYTPIYYKIDIVAQWNVIPVKSLENISPKPDLWLVNMKLPSCNSSRIPVAGKCSLTLAHKTSSFIYCCRLRLCTNSRIESKWTFATHKLMSSQ